MGSEMCIRDSCRNGDRASNHRAHSGRLALPSAHRNRRRYRDQSAPQHDVSRSGFVPDAPMWVRIRVPAHGVQGQLLDRDPAPCSARDARLLTQPPRDTSAPRSQATCQSTLRRRGMRHRVAAQADRHCRDAAFQRKRSWTRADIPPQSGKNQGQQVRLPDRAAVLTDGELRDTILTLSLIHI